MLFFAKYLSLHRDIQPFAEYAVTPCMGVWIETGETLAQGIGSASHPVWVCGLKLGCLLLVLMPLVVTPCMGVWIETFHKQHKAKVHQVTPCMGVWIETLCAPQCLACLHVTPCMGVWIETFVRQSL
mgnify:CR=1 FL=1